MPCILTFRAWTAPRHALPEPTAASPPSPPASGERPQRGVFAGRTRAHTPRCWVTTKLVAAMFFSADMQPSNVDLLLNRLDAAATGLPRGSAAPADGRSEVEHEGPPTLTDFLDEDDLLPECRSENTRLIEYLCKQEQILVRWWGRRVGLLAVDRRVGPFARLTQAVAFCFFYFLFLPTHPPVGVGVNVACCAAFTACSVGDIVGARRRCERFCLRSRARGLGAPACRSVRHGSTQYWGDC